MILLKRKWTNSYYLFHAYFLCIC